MTPVFDTGIEPPESDCPFCAIANAFPPVDPAGSQQDAAVVLSPDKVSPQAFVVLSTPVLVAFLDIMPLSRGHVLLCPRTHRPKLTDTTSDEAAELGRYLQILSKALNRTTGVYDWNVVQNNGAAAAQVVMHMHFHLIPRPDIRASGRYSESFTMFGRGKREELDEEDAEELSIKIRDSIAAILLEEEEDRTKKSKL